MNVDAKILNHILANNILANKILIDLDLHMSQVKFISGLQGWFQYSNINQCNLPYQQSKKKHYMKISTSQPLFLILSFSVA